MSANSVQTVGAPQCKQRALFLYQLHAAGALVMWAQFLLLFNAGLLAIAWWTSRRTRQCRKKLITRQPSHSTTIQRPLFDRLEQFFLATTVMLGLHILFFVFHCLLVQVQYFCEDYATSEGGFIAEWVVTVLISGGALGTTLLLWVNALKAVRDTGHFWHWYDFFLLEAYVIFSPLILVGIGILLLVRPSEALQDWRFLKAFKRWQAWAITTFNDFGQWRIWHPTLWWNKRPASSSEAKLEEDTDIESQNHVNANSEPPGRGL